MEMDNEDIPLYMWLEQHGGDGRQKFIELLQKEGFDGMARIR